MKKAYRISFAKNEGVEVFAEQERLQEAFKKLEENYVISDNHGYPTQIISYVKSLNFANIGLATTCKDPKVIWIELGTQLSEDHLEELVKSLDLPFDPKKVKFE